MTEEALFWTLGVSGNSHDSKVRRTFAIRAGPLANYTICYGLALNLAALITAGVSYYEIYHASILNETPPISHFAPLERLVSAKSPSQAKRKACSRRMRCE